MAQRLHVAKLLVEGRVYSDIVEETGASTATISRVNRSLFGINPQNDGRVIRLAFPQLTEERRKELIKQVKKYGEDAKVAVRNVRRDAVDYVKKAQKKGELTEDDQKKSEKDIQDLTDKFTKRIDEMCSVKEKELMEI